MESLQSHQLLENPLLSKNLTALNETTKFTNHTDVGNGFSGGKYLTLTQQIIITICYIVGLIGNLLALVFLYKKSTRPNNAKHRLMLRCLAMNDSIAMLGMMTQMYIQLYLSAVSSSIWFCRFRVLWRVFGLGSGCVAVIMAFERWLALTQPFLYQKHVTVKLIARSIFTLWTFAVVLVCMPFFGFGLYYEQTTGKCIRYRKASVPKDIAYAYLYFSLGLLLCICMVYCNLTVMRSLCNKSQILMGTNNKKRVLMRRVSRSCSQASNTSTREELAFGRLMGLICIIFTICWMPQLITIPLAQIEWNKHGCGPFYRVADMLMALHFLLDPYVYVLQRWPIFRSLFYPNNNRSSVHSKCSSLKLPSPEHSFFLSTTR